MTLVEGPQRAAIPKEYLGIFECKNCSLSENSYPVRPRGSWKARVWWHGEAAGMNEEKDNLTFCGNAGSETTKIFEEIGLDFDSNFIATNAVLCRPHPAPGDKKQNRTPTTMEVQTCFENTKLLAEAHKPDLIVVVGAISAKAILTNPPRAMGAMVGKFFGPSEHNLNIDADVYATWHPAYILRNMRERPKWKRQLVRLRDYMIGREITNGPEADCRKDNGCPNP